MAARQPRSFCGSAHKAATWQERSRATAVPAAMTNPAVFAGSVLAAVALWVGVYTALLPKHAPASSNDTVVTASESATILDLDLEAPAPSRWVDLPREVPVSASNLPVRDETPSTATMPNLARARNDHRAGAPSQIRRPQRSNIFVRQRFISERAYTPRRVHARPRYRGRPEPVQFSLATRSSS